MAYNGGSHFAGWLHCPLPSPAHALDQHYAYRCVPAQAKCEHAWSYGDSRLKSTKPAAATDYSSSIYAHGDSHAFHVQASK